MKKKNNNIGNVFERLHQLMEAAEETANKLAERMEKAEKDAKEYEDAFKAKNPLYKAFCRTKKPAVSLDVAEDFAIHILANVLCKKTVGKETEQEISEVINDFRNRLFNEMKAYKDHYALYLASGVLSDKLRKEEEKKQDGQGTKRDK